MIFTRESSKTGLTQGMFPRMSSNIGQAMGPSVKVHIRAIFFFSISIILAVSPFGAAAQAPSTAVNEPTIISIEPTIIRSNVKHFGINLSGQSFYDSGQMLRNLAYRNPGFEGGIWRTVLQCKYVKDDSCADNDEWSFWPADFVKGATFEFIYGAAKGEKGVVASSSTKTPSAHQGIWINFGKLAVHPKVGDFYIIRKSMPGEADTGWWTSVQGSGVISTELKDISPESPGKQALRLEASSPSDSASITANIDTYNGRSFIQLKGLYTLTFRAKAIRGANRISFSLAPDKQIRQPHLPHARHPTLAILAGFQIPSHDSRERHLRRTGSIESRRSR